MLHMLIKILGQIFMWNSVFLFFAGLVLSLGGFISFMVTGSITAIRFGLILGGVLLALSILSLRSFKKGETSQLALKGQTGKHMRLTQFRLWESGNNNYSIYYYTKLIVVII